MLESEERAMQCTGTVWYALRRFLSSGIPAISKQQKIPDQDIHTRSCVGTIVAFGRSDSDRVLHFYFIPGICGASSRDP